MTADAILLVLFVIDAYLLRKVFQPKFNRMMAGIWLLYTMLLILIFVLKGA